MAIKNRYEYLSGILEALDVEHTEAEVHNNEVWRSKVLDGMGVEHTYDDINQTDLWRAKVVEGIGNMSGGGSSDLSTAEVTIICNIEDGTTFEGAVIRNNRMDISQHIHNGSNAITCVLYKGENYCGTYDIDMSTAVITGNAEYSSEDDCYIVTGDCTITIS